jgi:hypothetical protein
MAVNALEGSAQV